MGFVNEKGSSMASTRFAAALGEARASGRVLLDLTESDPARCGLGWEGEELDDILRRRRSVAGAVAISEAREAIASYLAGHGASVAPDRVVLVRSRGEALRIVLELLCDRGGEALVPVPHRPYFEAGSPVRLRPYGLVFEERWRLDRRSIRRAVAPHTRAIIAGNPADPTGAGVSPDDLGFLELLCESRGLALIGDESFLDSSLEPSPSVASAVRCRAVHVGGLDGVCGLLRLEGEWLAVAGPEALAAPLASRLAAHAGIEGASTRPGVLLIPSLLGRREAFLSRLRARLARNRSALASASVREAPWTIQWGGGWWAVLEINPDKDTEELCLALLEEGVAVQPGDLGGLPQRGYLIVSLLPRPEVLDAALGRVEAQLRRPTSHSAQV
jgi:aspartate/methionine/tyrosine aminotransferase